MPYFKNSAGRYYWSLDGQTYSYLPAGAAGEKLMAKIDTARAIVKAVQAIAPTADLASDLEAEYFDAGTFADSDLTSIGITATELAACITLLQQVAKLMTNQATSPAMYRSTLNKVRRVST